MPAAFIEHRPKSTDKTAPTTHHAVVVDGKDVSDHNTQKEAKEAACKAGYRPVHVARERHLQNRDIPAHFRVDPC